MNKTNAPYELTSFSPCNFLFINIVSNFSHLVRESFESLRLLDPVSNIRQKQMCLWQLAEDHLQQTKLKTQPKSERE